MKKGYLVTGQFHKGKLYRPGDTVLLTDAEAADVASNISEADGQAVIASSSPGRIFELEAELRKHQETITTLNDEHADAVGALEKQIEELKTANHRQATEISDLTAENEQLKAAAAKPVTKGK